MREAHVAGSPCVRNGVRAIGVVLFALLCAGGITAQQVIPGNNVNMVSGTRFPTGDPFLQRQNEPSLAVSTRNPLHLLAGANDYRTVDLAGPFDPLRGDKMNADAWVGLFKSFDGGRTWQSTLLPGFPQDTSPEGLASPLKGRQAGTDPVVRAGTNGLFYYAGLGFDRGQNQPSTIFVARFIDLNNRENGDPIAYLGTHAVDSDGGVRFLDKPTLAIDVPRGAATCTIGTPRDDGGTDTQTIGAGNVYVAYSSFTGTGTSQQSQILFSRSTDCGVTWSTPKNLSTGSILNQNAQIAINPANGHIWITWRRFKAGDLQSDGIFITRSIDGGATFSRPTRVAAVSPFDQGTTETSFRTNAFQTVAIDDAGRVYVAWPERGHAVLRPDRVSGDARIVVSTSTTGTTWTAPRAIETGGLGHQIMPTLSFHGGRLRLIYYDLREDVSQIFGAFIDELPILASPDPKPPRHTIDAYVAQALPSAQPVFTAARLSDYAFGTFGGSTEIQRLQYNPPNLPLFRQGTAPFMGDYIDLAPSPVFVLGSDGVWRFNTLPSGSAVSHGVWTDNRDVRAPLDGDWANYTPVMSDSLGVRSLFDPTQTVSPCAVGQTGMRNQNIYTAKVTEGLFVASPGNTKPLGSIQRGFVIIVENARTDLRSYRLQILNQPPGGQASFQQFTSTSTPLTVLDASVPPLSTVARTVYVTSSDPFAPVEVSVVEIAAPGAGPIPGGQASTIVLNADATNPSIQNPSIQNPSIQNPDIQVAEAYNPAITTAFLAPSIQNPSIQNPSIQNPSIQNPSIQNPELSNDAIANPTIINPSIQNPSIQNPSIQNPSIQNPSIQNQDLVSGSIQDTSWVVTNDGNTTASYAIKLLMNGTLPDGFKSQLVLHKTYRVPSAQDCTLAQQPHTILLANIPDPAFAQVGDVSNPSIQNPSIQNATLSLAPGESANVTLRIVDPNRFDGIAFDAGAAIAPAAVAHSVNTEDAAQGITTPRVAIPLTITTAALTTGSPGGAYFASLQTFASTGTTSWTVTEGALPPGITLDPATGELSGTPTAPGNYVFTVRAVDANGNVDVQTLAIKIDPVVPDGFSRIWNGASNDWNDPRNWSPAGVPTTIDDVYISASIPVMPALTSDVTINSLVVESGATLDTNGFTLTLLGNGDGGNTIVGSGTVVMQGTGKTIRGTFPNLRITGSITAIGPITATGHLTLAPGAALNLNGFASLVGGRLVTMAGGAIAPVIIGAGFGDGTTLTVGGLDVDGLSLDRVILVVNGGLLSGFDNVRFTNYQPDDVHVTLNHPGTAAPFAMSGLSFFVVPTSGRYIQATDTTDDANALVVNVSASLPGDGSSRSETQGGAIINWLFDPNDISVGVTQSASPNPAVVGAPLTYTIVVANGGPAAATGVVVANPVPASTSFVSVETQQGACGLLAGVVSCDLGSLLAGQVVVITMVVLPGTAGTLNNTVSVTASETDPATNDNSQGVTTQVAQAGVAADLSLTKADSTDPVAAGVPFTYSLATANVGPGLATNVVVTDALPAGVTPSAASVTQGSCTIAGQTVTCQLGSLAAGASATVSITASAAAFGIVTNTASVFAAEADPDPSNNVSSETTVVGAESGCVAATFRGPELYEGPVGGVTQMSLVDMNVDGFLDLLSGHQSLAGPVAVLLNDGSGGFASPGVTNLGAPIFVATTGDFNGDGHIDVLAGVADTTPSLRLLAGDGTGALTPAGTAVPVSTLSLTVGVLDQDADGDLDILYRGPAGDLVLARNDGAGTFTATASLLQAAGASIATGDFNADGHTDIVASGTGQFSVLLADGNGDYAAPTTYSAGSSLSIRLHVGGDLNGDGHQDLLVGFGSGQGSATRVRFGSATGTFGPEVDTVTGSTANAVIAADVNGDGHLDLVSNHSRLSTVAVQLGNGAGGFAAPAHFPTTAYSNPAVGDVDGDGRPDIVSGDEDGTLGVLLNACGQPATDLGISVAESADPVIEGAEFVYTVTLTNHSANDASDVVVNSIIVTAPNSTSPPNATVTSTTTGANGVLSVAEADGVYSWAFPTVAANSSLTIELRVRAHAGGTVWLTSGVTSNNADTNSSNNTVFEQTTITATGRDLVVTNTNDTGTGSLRQAILDSNADTGDLDRIVFAIPGTGPHTIVPLTALPTISQPAVIDGTTQPGFAGTPIIELNGSSVLANGLLVSGGGTTVRGLAINRFGPNGAGIRLESGGGNLIVGNFLGTDVTGTLARANAIGVYALSANNVIGGTAPGDRNVISGNSVAGVQVAAAAGTNNRVVGNFIGTNAAGTAAVANGSGVRIISGSNNAIGGSAPGERNVISGNGSSGIAISGAGTTANIVVGNYIGLAANGSTAVPNQLDGIFIDAPDTVIGGTTTGARNVISGNGGRGIALHAAAAGSTIAGNFIGTDATGTAARANGTAGIGVHASAIVIGGLAPGAGNVISGNGTDGVALYATNISASLPAASANQVLGNLIGVNASGTQAIPNVSSGIYVGGSGNIIGGTSAAARNVISGNGGQGVGIGSTSDSTGNVVQGNYIGTNSAGTSAIPNVTGIGVHGAGNTIGGTASGAGNLIAGNSGSAVGLWDFNPTFNLPPATDTLVQGNLIGTTASGTLPLGNGSSSIHIGGPNNVIGGSASGAGNVIAATSQFSGIHIDPNGTGTIIQGNFIGTDRTATINLGGAGGGVFIRGNNNTVGGPGAGEGNTIAFNAFQGVVVETGTGNRISGNSIFSNGQTGIDLFPFSLTPNDTGDGDSGANNLQNFPVLTSADSAGGSTTVQGTLNSTANTTFRLEFFSNTACDGSGHGEGQTFVGATNVTTDTSGNGNFLATVGAASVVTATATDPAGNTSEFSACLSAGAASTDLAITMADSADPVLIDTPFSYTLTVSNTGPSTALAVVVTDDVPASLSISSATSSVGSCSITGQLVTCNLGSVAPGESPTVTITAVPASAGLVSNTATVSSDTADPTPGNNTATETTMVSLALACAAPTFSGPTAFSGSAGASSLVFLADMNSDGAPDIVTAHHTGSGSGAAVLLNDGTGAFGPRIPATSTTATVLPTAVADFNGDTHPDVLLIELIEQGNRLRLLLGDGTGTLTPQTVFAVVSNTSFFATAADVDGDGDQDVLARGTAGDLVLFRNGGTGLFAAPVSLIASSPTEDSPVVADFNEDNRPDILISGPGAAFSVLLANAGGGFGAPVTVPTSSAPRVRAVGDVNGDGHLDIAITEGSAVQRTARLTLRFGDGAGAFGPEVDVVAGNTVGVTTAADINGDGHADLITTHTPLNTVAVQLGDGSGGFAAPVHFSTPMLSNPAVADLNDDGRPDIVVGDITGTLRVLLNTCGQPPIDLGLTLVESADPINEGQELVYTVTLTNHSASPATAITLTTVISNATNSVTLPNASVQATSSGGGTLSVSGTIFTWTLPSVAAQDDVTFVFRVTPQAARDLSFTSTVTSSGQDTNASNNTVSETTTVTAAGLDLVVTNTNDSGPGSLRQAILDSNADSGDVDRIVFNIPGSGPHTIVPLTSLPANTQPVIIDGTTQPGFGGTPIIELNGNGLFSNGLAFTGGSSTVRGLAINRFSGSGINLATNGGNVVTGNFIGTDVTGAIARPNVTGITVNTAGNTIGGTAPGSANLVSGNSSTGIVINAAASNTQVIGNRIGTNISGTAGLTNGSGIVVTGAAGTVIGGTTSAHRNLISGGGSNGILIQSGATNTRVEGNYIGTNALGTGQVANGIGITVDASSNNTIGGTAAGAGNVISGNSTGVLIQSGASGNLVQGNRVGTNATGTAAVANAIGIRLIAAPGNTIGGSASGAGNVVSGNANGVLVELSGASGNLVQGNLVGTSANGTAAIPNTSSGIWIRSNASGNTVGGAVAGARNVISGNNNGIRIADGGSTGNAIAGNFIGTDISGTLDLGNAFDGISVEGAPNTIIGGTTASARNVVSGNNSVGIRLTGAGATGTIIQGNYVGTDAGGTAAVGNSLGGISIGSSAPAGTIGGTGAGAGNLISGNNASGLILNSVSNQTVVGNLIGTNASGTTALPNSFGVFIFAGGNHTIGGTSAGARNLISGNSAAGIQIDGGSSGNSIQGNYIGTNATGTASIANGAGINVLSSHGNTIGGAATGAGNVISGNTGGNGIWINASNSNTVQGNRIGTNVDGSAAVPNGFGMFVMGEGTIVGGATAGAGNLISGNANIGISVAAGATSTILRGNLIGTSAAGTNALPNGSHGVFLDGTNTTIGGTTAGAANIIAYNGLAGVRVNTGTGHAILGNSIRDNVDLGIDIGPFGTTVNDAGDGDSGANNLQNFPVLTSALTTGGTTAVGGTLNSAANTTFRLEFFLNTACDGSGHGEGQTFAGFVDVTTDGTGNGSFNTVVPGGGIFTATATDPNGNTSEFAACRTATTTTTPQTFTVANTNDGGAGSFRQAILDANANSGALDTIAFSIGTGLQTISPASSLPTITDPVIIDGTTQPGFAGVPLIQLDGTNAGATSNGLHVTAGGTTIRGLVINRFGTGGAFEDAGGAGIALVGTGGNLIEGNFIGTNAAGMAALPNRADGIWVDSPSNVIGGTAAAARNVISGNGRIGLLIFGNAASGNQIRGNFIGTNAAGTAALANAWEGVVIGDAPGNTVGGTLAGARNVISGNANEAGVLLTLAGATGNTVAGNYVGVDVSGAVAIPNAFGVRIINGASNNVVGGTPASARNVISGNSGNGVYLRAGAAPYAANNLVQGNFIGLNAAGTAAVPNFNGVEIILTSTTASTNNVIGGTAPGAGNVISGNTVNGVIIHGPGTLVQGNLIGTNPAGTAAIGNGVGVQIRGSSTFGPVTASNNTIGGSVAAARNIISGNNEGLLIVADNASTAPSGNLIQGNYIGVNAAGTAAIANNSHGVAIFRVGAAGPVPTGNVIGGTGAAVNVISGNAAYGIQIQASDNIVRGNTIGLRPDWGAKLPNGLSGINIEGSTNTIGGSSPGQGNIVTGNGLQGIRVGSGSGNVILGNVVGGNPTSTAASLTGNGQNGIFIAGSNTVIGGQLATERNIVERNGLAGVNINGGAGNGILFNSIHANGGLGIDLGTTGVTTNDTGDGDSGANNLQNFPVITSATVAGANVNVTATLNSTPNATFRVQFFGIADLVSGAYCDATGFGEGQNFLAETTVNTDGSGNAAINLALPLGSSEAVTATATSAGGSTSEFSACVTLSRTFVVSNTLDSGAGSLRQAILDANARAGLDRIHFSIGGGGVHTIVPASALPQITSPVIIDGTTQPGYAGAPVIELNGNGISASGLVVTGGSSTVRGLSIGGFVGFAVQLGTSGGNVVAGNFIGTDATGTIVRANNVGIAVSSANNTIGGFLPADGNLVSGSSLIGMNISGAGATGNVVYGNKFGTDVSGTVRLANNAGIQITGASNNVIGGPTAFHRNIIGDSVGLTSGATFNRVEGNYIGTNVSGTAALGGFANGVSINASSNNTVGGTSAGTGNLISGNGGNGVVLTGNAVGNTIAGNLIGTRPDGVTALANGLAGLAIQSSTANGNLIGGTALGAGNVIAFNTAAGVSITAGTGNQLVRNAIFQNGGLGIDLGTAGVTPNDAGDVDTGANNLQNFPVITSASVVNGVTTVQGTLSSSPSTTFRLEFFSNTVCDASGNGEGQTLLGTTTVTTNTDGLAAFSVLVGQAATAAATATDPSGNTSEFSGCVATTAGTSSVTQINLSAFTGGEQVETYSPNFGRLTSPVAFNGITYTSPGGQLWSDIVWENNGYYTNWPTASRGTALNDLVGLTNLQIDFTTPVNRVGVFAATSPVTTFIVTAYDDNLVAIGSVSSTMPAPARAAFLGLEAGVNIRRIVITEPFDNGQISIFDDLRFEPVQGLLGSSSINGKKPPKKGGGD